MRHSRKIERKTEKQKRHNGPVNGNLFTFYSQKHNLFSFEYPIYTVFLQNPELFFSGGGGRGFQRLYEFPREGIGVGGLRHVW